MFFLVIAFACIVGAAFVVGELVSLPARERALSIRRATSVGRVLKPEEAPASERLVVPLAGKLSALALKLHPRTTLETVDQRLVTAGLARALTAQSYLAIEAVLTLAGAGVGLAVGAAAGGAAKALLFGFVVGASGMLMPSIFVSRRIRARSERISRDLPNALDLLAVSVEAGLGFDGAVSKLIERMEGPLVDEFALALAEMRIGESREEALRGMAERVPSPELGAFVRAVIQADQLGSSLGKILRVQAADARLRRQAAVEERAAKMPIKMLFPTALFIFPAMFIVVLGSAFLNLTDLFDL